MHVFYIQVLFYFGEGNINIVQTLVTLLLAYSVRHKVWFVKADENVEIVMVLVTMTVVEMVIQWKWDVEVD